MKSNPLTGILAVATVAVMVFTAINTYRYFVWTNQMQSLLTQYAAMETMRMTVQNLANETLEYSKKHPAIDPTLQQFGIKPKPTNAPTASSSGQPLPK